MSATAATATTRPRRRLEDKSPRTAFTPSDGSRVRAVGSATNTADTRSTGESTLDPSTDPSHPHVDGEAVARGADDAPARSIALVTVSHGGVKVLFGDRHQDVAHCLNTYSVRSAACPLARGDQAAGRNSYHPGGGHGRAEPLRPIGSRPRLRATDPKYLCVGWRTGDPARTRRACPGDLVHRLRPGPGQPDRERSHGAIAPAEASGR